MNNESPAGLEHNGENLSSTRGKMMSNVPSTSAVADRKFSKTVAVTYVFMGLFSLAFLFVGVSLLWRGAATVLPLNVVLYVLVTGVGFGFVVVIWALHQRRNWARHVAVWFWMICLIWSCYAIVRNGLHPEVPSGPFTYDNEAQLQGARLGTLATPYFLAIVELTSIYCLLTKRSVVNQFALNLRADQPARKSG